MQDTPPSDPRDRFLALYPEVDPDELDALIPQERPPPTRARTAATATAGVLIGLALAAGLSWWGAQTVWDATKTVAPEVTGTLVQKKIDAARADIVDELHQGRGVALELVDFVGDLIRHGVGLDDVRTQVRGVEADMQTLRSDVVNLQLAALVDTGPQRLERIYTRARLLFEELSTLMNRSLELIVATRRGLRQELAAGSDVEALPDRLLEALDVSLAPLMRGQPELLERWADFKMSFYDWWTDLNDAVARARRSLDGDLLAGEFIEALYPAVVEEVGRRAGGE